MPVDVAMEPGLDMGTARHTHGEVIVAGYQLHLDIVSTRRSNPTFAFRDWRIYVRGIWVVVRSSSSVVSGTASVICRQLHSWEAAMRRP